MKVVTPGGSGQVGTLVRRALEARGHEVVVIARSSGVRWDGPRSARGRPGWTAPTSELILKSRRVVPGRLLEAGFEFRHPRWAEAAQDLVARRGRA